MNFRLIVEYHDTGIITEQYFPDMDTPDTIINYLDNALENGARLKYLLQQKTDTMDSNSWDYAGWYQLPECGGRNSAHSKSNKLNFVKRGKRGLLCIISTERNLRSFTLWKRKSVFLNPSSRNSSINYAMRQRWRKCSAFRVDIA